MISKYELALEEIRNNFRLQCEGVDLCKESARSSLNSSGLILALIGLLEGKDNGLFELVVYSELFWVWIATIVIFLIMIIVYVFAINPVGMTAPIRSTKESFKDVFFDHDHEKAVRNLITEYRKTIDRNNPALQRVSCLAKCTNWLGVISIFLAVVTYISGSIFA